MPRASTDPGHAEVSPPCVDLTGHKHDPGQQAPRHEAGAGQRAGAVISCDVFLSGLLLFYNRLAHEPQDEGKCSGRVSARTADPRFALRDGRVSHRTAIRGADVKNRTTAPAPELPLLFPFGSGREVVADVDLRRRLSRAVAAWVPPADSALCPTDRTPAALARTFAMHPEYRPGAFRQAGRRRPPWHRPGAAVFRAEHLARLERVSQIRRLIHIPAAAGILNRAGEDRLPGLKIQRSNVR